MSVVSLENESSNLLNLTTKVDEIKYLKDKTEKHYHENILKSFTIDNDFFKKSINV